MQNDTPTLVSTDWLESHLNDDHIILLDASWYKPEYGRVGWIEYKQEHIPGAGFFDLDEIVDLDDERPHMLPPEDEFGEAVGELGIEADTHVIVYDTHKEGFYSAARVWWVFRTMGHEKISVLDGGFAKWKAEKRRGETGLPPEPEEKTFKSQKRIELVRDLENVQQASLTGDTQIIDARSAERFNGLEDEGPGVARGHIPGSINLHYLDVFNPDATLKSADALENLFLRAGVDLQKPILTTCGSGITACILSIALDRLGIQDVPVYDASWSEWGKCNSCEIATGEI